MDEVDVYKVPHVFFFAFQLNLTKQLFLFFKLDWASILKLKKWNEMFNVKQPNISFLKNTYFYVFVFCVVLFKCHRMFQTYLWLLFFFASRWAKLLKGSSASGGECACFGSRARPSQVEWTSEERSFPSLTCFLINSLWHLADKIGIAL